MPFGIGSKVLLAERPGEHQVEDEQDEQSKEDAGEVEGVDSEGSAWPRHGQFTQLECTEE